MKRTQLISISIALIILVVTYFYEALAFLWLAIIVLSIVLIILAGAIRIFYRKLRSGWFRIPLFVILIGLVGISPSFFKANKPALPEKNLSLSDELNYLIYTDQHDRFMLRMILFPKNGGHNSIMYRDSIRLARVMKIVSDSLKMNPQDEYNAAMVLQHGNKPQHYELANKLSTDAANHNVESAEWLSHASWDRWQMSIGKPQKYGTQYTFGR